MSHRAHDPAFLVYRARTNGHALDVSGYGNDGVWAGTEQYGEFNKGLKAAADFDGASHIAVGGDPAPALLSSLTEATVCMWVKCRDFTGARRVFSMASAGNDRFGLFGADTPNRFGIHDDIGNAGVTLLTGTVFTNHWYHIAWTMGAGGIHLFLNGDEVATNAATDVFADIAGTVNLHLGKAAYTAGAWWDGLIYDVRMYGVVLSRDEINSIIHEPVGEH